MGERGDQGDRGIRGERGPQGDHGQPGEQGPAGANVVDEIRERKRDRKALYRAASLMALPVALVALIPSLAGLYLLKREVNSNVERRRQTTYQLCLASKTNRDELRDFLILARDSPPVVPPTVAEALASTRFYRRALADIAPIVCRPGGLPEIPSG